MKRALAIILTLMLLAVCLTGCSGQDSANSSAQVGSGNSGSTESAMPDYYDSDPGFYFGILCELFWDPETTGDLEEAAPETYAILKELIQ